MKNILIGDSVAMLKTLESGSVDCIITSPPYFGLRDYGIKEQIGLEDSFEQYINRLLEVTAECHRVLKDTGTLWWNHGDSYSGSGKGQTKDGAQDPKRGKIKGMRLPPSNTRNKAAGATPRGMESKSLLLQAYRLAIRMTDEQQWILRNQIIWHKPNVMPSSAKDRFTNDFEPLFFFSKSERYYFNRQYEPVAEVSLKRAAYGFKSAKANLGNEGGGINIEKMGSRFVNPKGRNMRTTWRIPTSGSKLSHVAMFPEALVQIPILAGCPEGGVVLDPFCGAGTTGVVAAKLGRDFIGIELNPEYAEIAWQRINSIATLL